MFDPKQNAWRKLAPLPEGRHHHSTVVHAGAVYVFGGTDAAWRSQVNRMALRH
jgi:N-acetylneuraminic acid mutarotase